MDQTVYFRRLDSANDSVAAAFPAKHSDYIRIRTDVQLGSRLYPSPANSAGASHTSAAYAVHTSLARQCRLLDTVLDEAALNGDSGATEPADEAAPRMGDITVVIPDCDAATAEAVFEYLVMTARRLPSILSRPLKAPLAELVQPWELDFIERHAAPLHMPGGGPSGGGSRDEGAPGPSTVSAHLGLLRLMRAADFLIIDSLRDLCCAHFASALLCNCRNEQDALTMLGLHRAANKNETKAVYELYPFLQPKAHGSGTGGTPQD